MQPHEQRVVDEKRDLDEKRAKLQEFVEGSQVFATLPEPDQALLKEQWEAMTWYSTTLASRIERFPTQPPKRMENQISDPTIKRIGEIKKVWLPGGIERWGRIIAVDNDAALVRWIDYLLPDEWVPLRHL